MTREEIIEQLNLAIGLIKQDGKDWLDDRDIPMLEECVKALSKEPCKRQTITREEALDYAKSELDAAYKRAKKIGHKGKTRYIEALEMAIQALSQEPNRDIKEIAEIMKCDVDAETKCKMISNILTAKPHYFEKQTVQDKQAESEKYQKAFDDGYDNGYAQAGFDYEQKPCDNVVSREAILSKIKEVCFSKEWTQFRIDNGSHGQRDFIIDYIEQLPSVNPQYTGNEFFNFDAPMVKKSMEQDVISRQAMLDYLKANVDDFPDYHEAIEKVLQMPSVTQKLGKWIPVSNRLPFSDEEYHTFLVTDSNGKVTSSEFYLSLSDGKPYWSGIIDVIAWMPLPKPYEPQESEENNG